MNKLRRVHEKPRASQPAASPAPARKEKKEEAPRDPPPGHEDFQRAVNALWGQAFLELALRAEEEETWE